MPARRHLLAKLTRPRLHTPVARERLFALLDEGRERPLLWLSGPPGAGKTTAAASWLAARGHDGLWYQLDAEDADPATFFYYLRQGARAAAPRARPLPLFTPEYLSDLEGFTRRWFRALFHQLPLGALCVFDNYHEIDADSALHRVFATAVREVPAGAALMVLSRGEPPPRLSGAMAADQVAHISWEALRLTPQEIAAIAASRGETDAQTVQQLHVHSDGWAAGVTLMLERLRSHGGLARLDRHDAVQGVFDYFASQILDATDEATRRVLLNTAFFQRITSSHAEAISGVEGAGRVLEALYRRHLFTERRPGEPPHYEYHPLFQMFLRKEARGCMLPEDCRSVMRHTARLVADAGDDANAFALYVEAADWPAAIALVLDRAPTLLAQGRWQTLQEWVQRVPDALRAGNPWLEYWHGRSLLQVDPVAARPMLEHTYAALCETAGPTAQLLAAAAVLEALYFEFRDFTQMDRWIERVAGLLAQEAQWPSAEDELRVNSTLMMAASYRAPEHPMLARCVQRTAELLDDPLDVNLRVAAVSMLLAYHFVAVDFAVEQIALQAARRLLDSPEVTAVRAAFCIASEGYAHYVAGRHAQAMSCFDRSIALSREHGLDGQLTASLLWRGLCERRAGLLDEAEATIARIEGMLRQPTGQRAAQFALVRAVVAFDRGQFEQALHWGREAQRRAEQSGQFNGGMLLILVTANIAIGAGDFELAMASLQRVRQRITGPVTANYLAAAALNEAWLAHRRGDSVERDARLREALEQARDPRAALRLGWYPNSLSELLPVALQRGIAPETARRLAHEFGIRPATENEESWPWPVRVRAFGRLELLIDGAPPAFSRKMPRKPLALLAAIIALGGTDVPDVRVVDALWPDDDGDAAYRSLTTTVRRLREILCHRDAVRHAGGKLSLDPQRCWVDAWAFERALKTGGTQALMHAIELYRGAFLERESEAGWTLPMRERLRGKLVQAVLAVGEALEREARHADAIACYLKGLDADDMIEAFYQGLMRCYGRLGRDAEALNAYHRLRQLLSISLGAAPSPATERLLQSLRPA